MPGPAVLQPYDPTWPARATRLLTAVRAALAPLGVAEAFEHIGSTAVPGLPAKAYVDLQVTMSEFPEPAVLDAALAPTGFEPAVGARPDSPGVHRDLPRGAEVVADDVWRKRLFVRDRYAAFKAAAAAEHAGDPDFDDYTRAKTAFFDEVQDEFEAWGRRA
ncbi:GrpB family protein [Kineococcus sp. NPDC059986]|uniref:GrpB family protein n=1 Tax=Kineococcus sp. NPDC059986 TaxID=3155538 RepID=UPI00344C073E